MSVFPFLAHFFVFCEFYVFLRRFVTSDFYLSPPVCFLCFLFTRQELKGTLFDLALVFLVFANSIDSTILLLLVSKFNFILVRYNHVVSSSWASLEKRQTASCHQPMRVRGRCARQILAKHKTLLVGCLKSLRRNDEILPQVVLLCRDQVSVRSVRLDCRGMVGDKPTATDVKIERQTLLTRHHLKTSSVKRRTTVDVSLTSPEMILRKPKGASLKRARSSGMYKL